MNKPQFLVRLEVLGKLKKLIHLIGSQTRHLPTSSKPTEKVVLDGESTLFLLANTDIALPVYSISQ
jgi:hypothetical protein